ncbi:hypothetical protein [Bacillus alkalicellulosilyticus]|uniref:hypothetical protein n=1 Tax=Alkalihalobacterium alkalicellulosilyticum TaxID=1912214 RepID=UPI000996D6E8|nr:hypothetical protein [Bacillus alkalicellulosilyticus]
MSGVIFGLLATAMLLGYGSIHTFIKAKQWNIPADEKNKVKKYSIKLMLLSIMFLGITIVLLLIS